MVFPDPMILNDDPDDGSPLASYWYSFSWNMMIPLLTQNQQQAQSGVVSGDITF